MLIEEKELMEMKEKDLKEVSSHIDAINIRLKGEFHQLNVYLEKHYNKWIALVNEIKSSLKSKGMSPSLPAFIIEYANDRLAFLIQKKAYIEECLDLISKYDAEKGSADIEKLTEIDAVLTSIANSLGFFNDIDGSFAEGWYGKEEHMRFLPRSSSSSDRAYEALEFLRNAYEQGKIAKIENMDGLLDALDIAQELEYAKNKLKDFNLDY